MNELRDEVRRFAWSLSPADMATLSELDAESRIYWLRELLDSFICASCELAGIRWRVLVNPLVAAVVPWDVMGDSRAFAFVCDGCASGSAVVL